MTGALESTYYCDHNHPDVCEVARNIRKTRNTTESIVSETFLYVRDDIAFGFDLFEQKASETLKKGYGACWNKSLLLVALLRCNNIPAHFCSVPLKRDFIKPAIGLWHILANSPYNHCLVQVNVNDKWTIVDAVLDKNTFESFYAPLGVSWEIDWNGKDDMRLYSDSILGQIKVYHDIDKTINMHVGNKELPTPLAKAGNGLVNKIMWQKTGYSPRKASA